MLNILNLLLNSKIFYLIIIILIMTIINIILSKSKINGNYKYLINGISLILISIITSYYKDIVDAIFNLKYLSIKLYMFILVIVNIIMIYTINKKINKIYKIINYLLFGIIYIILAVILVLVLGINLNLIEDNLSTYNILLINISIIMFMLYLVSISIICIYKILTRRKKEELEENVYGYKSSKVVLTKEELLSVSNKELFTIDGVDCSIIFEDSIPDNIVKNYHILLNDINDKLVNGYTLEENKILKSICYKLDIKNLDNVDINNLSILNKISVEEYNFLKRIGLE